MTAPRWLREQRRARARLTRTLAHLPATLDHVTKQLVSLRVHTQGLAEQIDALRPLRIVTSNEPVRWSS